MSDRLTWEQVEAGEADEKMADLLEGIARIGGIHEISIDLAGRVTPHPLLEVSNEPNGDGATDGS